MKLKLLESTVDGELKAVVASESCLLLSPWLYRTAGIWMISLFSVATEHLAIPLLMKYDSLLVSNQMAGSWTPLAV